MASLVSLIIFVIILGIVLYIAKAIIAALTIAEPFGKIAYALIVLLFVFLFCNEVGIVGPAHYWRTWK